MDEIFINKEAVMTSAMKLREAGYPQKDFVGTLKVEEKQVAYIPTYIELADAWINKK